MSKSAGEKENNGVLFRTAFKGYNKQDVNDYIAGLIRSNESSAEHYSSHIRSIEEDRAENAKKILELSNKNEMLTGVVQSEAEARLAAERECEELKARLASIQDKKYEEKIAELSETLKNKDEQIAKLEQDVARLKKQVPQSGGEHRPNLYERIKTNLTGADKSKK